jgi:predicted nucleic acid-binding Zn ribbon protein
MSQPRPIRNVLDVLLKRLGIETQVKQRLVVVLWPEVVGDRIAEIAKAERVIDGVLFVTVTSSVWRVELLMHKEKIIGKLNRRIGKPVITEIRFV